ncbi:Dipeptide transport system permease protein DppB [compost metagenome]
MWAALVSHFVRRLAVAVPTMMALSVVVFVVLRLLPADPLGMMLPPSATSAEVEALRHAMGFDRSLIEQYGIWLGQVLHGDLGRSISSGAPVAQLIATTLPATLELSFVALVMALAISVPGGLLLYVLHDRRGELVADAGLVLLISIPGFLWGIFLMLAFGVHWPILPFSGRFSSDVSASGFTGFVLLDCLLQGRWQDWADAASHLVLPALALALGFSPLIVRVLRASLLEASHEQYVTVARLRGQPERRVILRHMLRNAFLPTLTLIGVQFGFLFGGTLLIEMIFSFPGLGNMMVQAVRNHDLPLIQGISLVFCAVILLINASVDCLYAVIDPRLRDL